MRKSDRTRQRIVDSASRLFYRKGYNRTSFSDVVEAAGVPRGNIYYYFKTKDDILRAVIRHRLDTLGQMLGEWDKTLPGPYERLRRFVQLLPNNAASLAQAGCPMGTLNAELGKDQPDLRGEARAMFDLFGTWLERQFAELGYAGRSRALAIGLVARAQGISLMAFVYGDEEFLERETRELERWVDGLARE